MNFFGVTKKYDFARGNLMPGVIMMALPLIGIAVLNGIYNLVTQLFVNRIGNMYGFVSIAGHSTGSIVIGYFLAFAAAVMVAATVVVARSCGKQEPGRISASVNTALLVSVIVGVILAVIMLIFGRQIAYNYYTYDYQAVEIAGRYIKFNVLYVLFSTVFYGLIGSMYGMGDSVRPLIIYAIRTLMGIVLNILVAILGFGINAIAIVNTFTALVGVVLALVCFLIGDGEAKLNFGAGFHGKSLAFLLVLTLTAGLQALVFQEFARLDISMFSVFSGVAVAAYSAASVVSNIVNGIPSALIPVILAVVSQASGAGDARKAFKNAGISVAIAVLPAFMLTIVLLVVGPLVARIFYSVSDYQFREYLPILVRTGVVATFFTSAMLAVTAAIRARGATVLAALSSCIVTFGVTAIIYSLVEYNGIIWMSVGKMGIGFASLIPIVIVFVVVNLIAVATEKPGSKAAPAYAAPAQNFDTVTGRPVQQVNTGYNFDPMTGKPIQKANPGYNFDPMTGKPLNQQNDVNNDNSQYIDKY